MSSYEVEGTYGGSKTESTIFVVEGACGMNWYAAMGSTNVNCTHETIEEGCDIEELDDFDFFTANKEIESLEDLEGEVNEL